MRYGRLSAATQLAHAIGTSKRLIAGVNVVLASVVVLALTLHKLTASLSRRERRRFGWPPLVDHLVNLRSIAFPHQRPRGARALGFPAPSCAAPSRGRERCRGRPAWCVRAAPRGSGRVGAGGSIRRRGSCMRHRQAGRGEPCPRTAAPSASRSLTMANGRRQPAALSTSSSATDGSP